MFSEPARPRGHVGVLMAHTWHHHFAGDRSGNGHTVFHDWLFASLNPHRSANEKPIFTAHVALRDPAADDLSSGVEVEVHVGPFIAGHEFIAGPRIGLAWAQR